MSNWLKLAFLLTDLGFLTYWAVTLLAALGVLPIPGEWLYQDYDNPLMVDWNWSFMPLDVLASVTGLTAVYLAKRQKPWAHIALVSMTLTFCAGFMAICFWMFRADYNLGWWLPNLGLCLWPLLAYRGVRAQL